MSATVSNALSGLKAYLAPSREAEAAPATGEPSESSPSFTPLWLVNSGGQNQALELLGIRMPRAGGDLSVFLAQASLTLEQNIDEAEKSRSQMSLAALARALNAYNLEALGKNVDNQTAKLAEDQATRDAFGNATSTLLNQQSQANSDVATYSAQVSQLQQALQNPNLKPEEKAALQSQLSTAQNNRSDAMNRRDSYSTQLAQARIDNLDRQISDLRTQLGRVSADSTEGQALQSRLSAKQTERSQAQTALSNFQSATKTDQVRSDFYSSTRSAVQNQQTGLNTRANETSAGLDTAKTELLNGSALASVVIANAFASLATAKANQMNDQTMRSVGIESAFEAIADTLNDATASLARVGKADEALAEGRAQAVDRRIAAAAAALINALSDVFNTLSLLEGSPQSPLAPPPETVADRVRLAL